MSDRNSPEDADGATPDGLYQKYEVRKNGEPIEDCFVLEPADDHAAREALIRYAEETNDEELGEDLRDWVTDICTQNSETHHVEGVGMDTVVRCEDTGNAYGPGTVDPSTPGYCPYCGDRVGDDQHRIAESFDEVFCDNTGMSTWRYCPGCGESGVEINA